MPRADFYLIKSPRFRDDPMRLVCELARRCHATAQPTLILARDRAQAEQLDDLLWAFDPEAYLPHQLAGQDEDEDDVPILIAAPEFEAVPRPLQINLRDAAVETTAERVLEVVPADESAREPLRQRWRAYAARGLEVFKHDM